MPDRTDITALVIESVRLLADDFEISALQTPDTSTPLYGTDAPLDSMALVNLIADIEEALAEKFDVAIALADEKAMSIRNSPFRDVNSLVDAIAERIAL
jgi:acyl carrier protein